MAEPKQPEITMSERLDGAGFRELMPETRRSRRGGMGNLASSRGLDVFFRSRWTQGNSGNDLSSQRFKSSMVQ